MGLKAVASSGTSLTPTFTSVTTPLVIGGTAVGSTLTLQSTTATGTTDKVLVKVGTNGGTTAGTFDHNGFNGTIGGTTAAAGSFTSVTSSALTAGRVPFAGTAGLLSDAASLTFTSGTGALAATLFAGALNGTVGATTPAAGTFTTLAAASIALNGTTALSNYTEAAWTPVDASGASLTFTVNAATYTRIGRMILAMASITFPSTVDGNNVTIGGLPVASANSQANRSSGTSHDDTSGLTYAPECVPNGVTFQLWNVVTGVKLINSALTTRTIFVNIIYFA